MFHYNAIPRAPISKEYTVQTLFLVHSDTVILFIGLSASVVFRTNKRTFKHSVTPLCFSQPNLIISEEHLAYCCTIMAGSSLSSNVHFFIWGVPQWWSWILNSIPSTRHLWDNRHTSPPRRPHRPTQTWCLRTSLPLHREQRKTVQRNDGERPNRPQRWELLTALFSDMVKRHKAKLERCHFYLKARGDNGFQMGDSATAAQLTFSRN